MILFEHSTPTGLLLAALALAAAVVIFSAWRHLSWTRGHVAMCIIYGASLSLLAWCMLIPGRKEGLTRLLKPKFAVALDTSASMALRPAPGSSNRWEAARHVLAMPWLSTIASECDVEIFPLAEGIGEPRPPEDAAALVPEGNATHLRDSLKDLAGRYSGLNVAGVLLLSDGLDTREAFDDWAADDRPFPVFSAPLETPNQWEEEVEVRIDAVSTPRRVSVDWQSECNVLLSGQGTRGEAVVAQLFKNGVLLDEKPTQIAAGGGERELVFDLDHSEIGVFNYRVYVPPLAGENNTNDNEHVVSVQVTDARNRLLYVEGTPRWEYKFLRRVLLAEQEVTPVIFYAGPDGSPRRGTGHKAMTADMTPGQLAFFKIVILGNLSGEELGEERANHLVDFVEEGGSLVLLGGTRAWGNEGLPATPLRTVLPVRGQAEAAYVGESPFPVLLTDAARAHPAFAGDAELWSMVPPILSVFPGPSLSPTAQALVMADTPRGRLPVVVSHRVGQGKVAVLLTDSLWKWQLSPKANVTKPYQRFWTQLLSWLLPKEEDVDDDAIEIFADREQLFLGEEIEITARMGGEEDGRDKAAVQTAVTFPDERRVSFDMTAQWVSTPSGKSFPGHILRYKADEPGLHVVVAESETGGKARRSNPLSFYVKPYSPETIPRPINDQVLRTIAGTSGGQFYETLEDLNLGLSALRPRAMEEATAEFRTLWRTWPVLLVLLALFIASWTTRKARGMP